MRPIDFGGCMATSQASILDRKALIVRRFYFMRDMIKCEGFIFSRMDVTEWQ